MENRINVAELLKDCQGGMELDCSILEGIEFDSIIDSESLPICCRIKNPHGGYTVYNFTKYGCLFDAAFAKCVIFPKGKTTWEGFVPPCKFKDGDVMATKNTCGIHIFIYNNTTDEDNRYGYYVALTCIGNFKINGVCSGRTYRLATEEEKGKLFQAIKENGYKWDEETKTLDKLVPNKFDITTLKPFESKVLVRDRNTFEWRGHFFSHYDKCRKRPYVCIGAEGITEYKQCIPYEGNEHLLGTTEDCEDRYKMWLSE